MVYAVGVIGVEGVVVVEVVAVYELEIAPKRCCNNSAIRMVVLSMADLGR